MLFNLCAKVAAPNVAEANPDHLRRCSHYSKAIEEIDVPSDDGPVGLASFRPQFRIRGLLSKLLRMAKHPGEGFSQPCRQILINQKSSQEARSTSV